MSLIVYLMLVSLVMFIEKMKALFVVSALEESPRGLLDSVQCSVLDSVHCSVLGSFFSNSTFHAPNSSIHHVFEHSSHPFCLHE